MPATPKDVLNYLTHLKAIKSKIEFPINMEKDGELYHIMDGDGNRILTLTEKLYNIFQNL